MNLAVPPGEDKVYHGPMTTTDASSRPVLRLLLRRSGARVLRSLLFADAPRDLHVDDVCRRRRSMTLPDHSFLDVPVDRESLVDCLERECALARGLLGGRGDE